MEWYIRVLKNYVNFKGRARRKEFWMFNLFNGLITLVLAIIESIANIPNILANIYSFAVLLPMLAVTARRLHDIGKSGWWQLIAFIPVVGTIILLVMTCKDSNDSGNKYGANPKSVLS